MKTPIEKLVSAISTVIALQIATLVVVAGTSWYAYRDLKLALATAGVGSRLPNAPERVEGWEVFVREHNAVQGSEEAPERSRSASTARRERAGARGVSHEIARARAGGTRASPRPAPLFDAHRPPSSVGGEQRGAVPMLRQRRGARAAPILGTNR
ncbi:MAG TPA: hypothetical protein VF193_14025 [Steroidobacter sp.]